MRQNPSEDGLLRRYFLGEMSQEEMEELEKRFGDDEFFELAEAVESDLLAAAARGELAPAERERVLRRLASSPQGRERLAFIRALNKVADEEQRATPNVVRFPDRAPASRRIAEWVTALAASLLVIAGLTGYVMYKQNSSEAQLPEISERGGPEGNGRIVPPRTPEKQPVAGPVQPVPSVPDRMAGKEEQPVPKTLKPILKPIGRAVLQLVLMAPRGAETQETLDSVRLTPDIGFVDVQLDVSEYRDFESFDVALRNQEHETIWQKSGLASQPMKDWGPALVFEVDAAKLAAAGRYEVRVQGRTAGGETQALTSLEFEVVTSGEP